MDKENNILKNRILQLIYKELENIGGENIFSRTQSMFRSSPIETHRFTSTQNIDYSEITNVSRMIYSLDYEDGEPSIQIFDIFEHSDTIMFYKSMWTWFGKKTFNTTITILEAITRITCGHITFNLSTEEREELLEKTILAWEKFQSLEKETEENKVIAKINDRLQNKSKIKTNCN